MRASTTEKLLAWFVVYLIVACGFSTVFAVLTLVHIVYPSEMTENMLFLFSMGGSFVLLGIGVASAMPLSEYAYMRKAGINPAIARESIQHQRRTPEKRDLGIVLGIVGITCVFGVNPWQSLFFLVGSSVGVPMVTIIMVASLILLVQLYRKQFQQYLEF